MAGYVANLPAIVRGCRCIGMGNHTEGKVDCCALAQFLRASRSQRSAFRIRFKEKLSSIGSSEIKVFGSGKHFSTTIQPYIRMDTDTMIPSIGVQYLSSLSFLVRSTTTLLDSRWHPGV